MANKNNSGTTVDTSITEVPPGERGVVGIARPAQIIKLYWHEATHILMDVGNAANPRKQKWLRKTGTPSLKLFARQLLKSTNEDAGNWFANKRGACDEKRSDANHLRVSLERQATRLAKRKREQNNGKAKEEKK